MAKFDLDVGEWGLLLGFLDSLIVLPEKVQKIKDKLDIQYSKEVE